MSARAVVRPIRPHDLLWVAAGHAFHPALPVPAWLSLGWRAALPLVVRRDCSGPHGIPVGARGGSRGERCAGWVAPQAIVRVITPPQLVADAGALRRSPWASLAPLRALMALRRQHWPLTWGVAGSVGYALATGLPVLHAASDLDLVWYCPQPVARPLLAALLPRLDAAPCRIDAQVVTPQGGFALREWLTAGRVLLKTDRGPRLTDDPWRIAEERT
ncbi:malonate decarboxylase holo-ACP synthase [Pantoea sp. 1.19]|uniref:malonate decarboxylase holo-ACP synthase n=1 Tax=Pantoea sp. 1.19 TaxID=1925589 RepID=UPI0009FB8D7D|nr:malonate decarboxylase holo-ACP synthase [Pantoea sp. 1.19]